MAEVRDRVLKFFLERYTFTDFELDYVACMLGAGEDTIDLGSREVKIGPVIPSFSFTLPGKSNSKVFL